MKKENVDARIELDNDIRELVGFAFEQFGKKGVKYTVKELTRFVKSLNKEGLKIK